MSSHNHEFTEDSNTTKEQVPHSGVHHDETPHHEFTTPLPEAVEQGLVGGVPPTPRELTESTKEPGFFRRHKKGIAALAVANTLVSGAVFFGAKTLFTDRIVETLQEDPSLGGPVVPGEDTEPVTSDTDTLNEPETEPKVLSAEHGYVPYFDDPAMMTNYLVNILADTATERYETGSDDVADLQNIVSDTESGAAANLDTVVDGMVRNLERIEKEATEQGLNIDSGLRAGISIEIVDTAVNGEALSATAEYEYLVYTKSDEYIGHLNNNLDTITVTFEKQTLQDAEGEPVEVGVVTKRDYVQ